MSLLLPVVGGLSLFIYGMNLMSQGLQNLAGNQLKKLIDVLTSNRLMGIVVGTVITMVIQSSSALSVMVIGFVNAGLMSLSQSVGVLMGANIGTTITAQIIAFNITEYAPIAVATGVIVSLVSQKKKSKDIADTLIGLGVLFIGMSMMSNGLKPMVELPWFTHILASLNNPWIAMLAGLVLTTMVQSSSAFIGLVQALALQGVFSSINIVLPILYGSNIGTITTAMLAGIGASKNAKRTAVIHFLFNLIGTLLFMTVLAYPISWIVVWITPNNMVWQIANAHTIFNLVNVIIQFPFADWLVKIAIKVVPGEDEIIKEAKFLDSRLLVTPSIALAQAKKETSYLGTLALENLRSVQLCLVDGKDELIGEVRQREHYINTVEKEINDYLLEINFEELSFVDRHDVAGMINIVNDIERIGDHVDNIASGAKSKAKNHIQFSGKAKSELTEMFELCIEIAEIALRAYDKNSVEIAKKVYPLEEKIDKMEKKLRKNHIKRLNDGSCKSEPGVLFLDAISNLERVADHSNNIASYIIGEQDIEVEKSLTPA